jgi:hypothetical protein
VIIVLHPQTKSRRHSFRTKRHIVTSPPPPPKIRSNHCALSPLKLRRHLHLAAAPQLPPTSPRVITQPDFLLLRHNTSLHRAGPPHHLRHIFSMPESHCYVVSRCTKTAPQLPSYLLKPRHHIFLTSCQAALLLACVCVCYLPSLTSSLSSHGAKDRRN